MELDQHKWILTAIIVVGFVFSRLIVRSFIKSALNKYAFSKQREKITIRAVNIIMLGILIIFLIGIWGLKGVQIYTFFTSVLAVIGIAFFAQWSLLSNITAGLILFFNHPLKLGDFIKIVDGDNSLEGCVEDISFFFLHIRTKEDQLFTIPNSIVAQKTLSIVNKSS